MSRAAPLVLVLALYAACSSPALDQGEAVRLLTTPDTGAVAGIGIGEPWDRVVGDHPAFTVRGKRSLTYGTPEGSITIACTLDDAGKVRGIAASVGGQPAQNARVVDAIFRELRTSYDHATDAKAKCTERRCDYTLRTGEAVTVEFRELADQAAVATVTVEPKLPAR